MANLHELCVDIRDNKSEKSLVKLFNDSRVESIIKSSVYKIKMKNFGLDNTRTLTDQLKSDLYVQIVRNYRDPEKIDDGWVIRFISKRAYRLLQKIVYKQKSISVRNGEHFYPIFEDREVTSDVFNGGANKNQHVSLNLETTQRLVEANDVQGLSSILDSVELAKIGRLISYFVKNGSAHHMEALCFSYMAVLGFTATQTSKILNEIHGAGYSDMTVTHKKGKIVNLLRRYYMDG